MQLFAQLFFLCGMEQTTQDRKRQWLKSAVEQSGKTIKDVAELVGMDRTELSGMINGHRTVTDAKLDAVGSALGITIDLQWTATTPKGDG